MASSNANVPTPVPFPQPEATQSPQKSSTTSNPTPNSPASPARRSRTSTNASTASASSRIRAASLKFMEASPPPGMWAATGSVASKAPTIAEIRRGSFSASGWNEESQRYQAERRASQNEEGGSRWMPRRTSSAQSGTAPESPVRPSVSKGKRTSSAGAPGAVGAEPFPAVTEEEMSAAPARESAPAEGIWHKPKYDDAEKEIEPESKPSSEITEKREAPIPQRPGRQERQFSNGYVPPPKVPWKTSTVIGLKAFWRWFLTPAGFLITIYGLNVVAWGGMLFLLLCNAAPAMCHPNCNHIQSPRRIWIEIDSQILNALFCVTGFGLAPWRLRDLYWWTWWRLGGSERKETGIRRLAGIHRGWFRLPGSDQLPSDATASTLSPENPAVPIPLDKLPDSPPTGIHAPPTNGWKMDFVIWMNMWNTFFQIVLCFYMWHYDRYERPSWATGLFVALACIVAGLGGIVMFHEGKYVKKVEGVPIPKGYENRTEDVEAQSEAAQAAPAEGAKR
ncbi:hypothetical protein K469DRAFT_674604 [Zopfia rhizophila CBS 207.26]|uniref:Uncharacterized protein n=1 Tax=Zopfia rhizophila CBS 207.26 TaxID=1314779 RepID=A0A6A6DL70_9PEZI|nr:hypothetical protein K469DRAFT_674604 [Zopfia rhizophila CBS 207.26]